MIRVEGLLCENCKLVVLLKFLVNMSFPPLSLMIILSFLFILILVKYLAPTTFYNNSKICSSYALNSSIHIDSKIFSSCALNFTIHIGSKVFRACALNSTIHIDIKVFSACALVFPSKIASTDVMIVYGVELANIDSWHRTCTRENQMLIQVRY